MRRIPAARIPLWVGSACTDIDFAEEVNDSLAVQKPKNKGERPIKSVILREGKAGTDASVTAMRQVLNPLPVKRKGRAS